MSERVLWKGGSVNPIARVVAPLMLVITIGTAISGEYLLALVALVGTMAAAPYTNVQVTVTAAELRVALGPWGFPSESHQISEIDWIEADRVNRRDVRLGVGVRGSDKRLTGRAFLLRPGPVIRFQGRGGKRLTVTVDGADGAASVVEGLISPS